MVILEFSISPFGKGESLAKHGVRMKREIEKIVNLPEIQERLSASDAEPVASTPEQFGAYVASEVAKWDRVVKQAKIPPVQ